MSLFQFSWTELGCHVKNDWDRIGKKISDMDKYLFTEKGLRGGISYISKRYAKANNKYINDYDSKKASECITYLDMSHL